MHFTPNDIFQNLLSKIWIVHDQCWYESKFQCFVLLDVCRCNLPMWGDQVWDDIREREQVRGSVKKCLRSVSHLKKTFLKVCWWWVVHCFHFYSVDSSSNNRYLETTGYRQTDWLTDYSKARIIKLCFLLMNNICI